MTITLRTARRLLPAFLFFFLVTGTLTLLVTWIGSTRLIVPDRPPLEERHYQLLSKPSEYGLELEELDFLTEDGLVLRGILATRAPRPGVASETRKLTRRLRERGIPADSRPRGTIVLLHGRGGRKEDMLSIAKRFVAADFRCLVYDARAHGMSEGTHCTFGKREVADLVAIVRQTSDLLLRRGETIGPVGLFGNSLGAAVAIQATRNTEIPEAIVVVSPFTNLPEIVHRSGRRMIHRNLPRPLIRSCLVLGGWRAGFDPFSIIPLEDAKTIHTPLFVAHGALDEVIPIAHGKRIFAETPSEEKVWYEIETGEHGNVLARGGNDLYEEMTLFYLRSLSDLEPPVTASR